MEVRGYKVFNHDWTCSPRGNLKHYACPGNFTENVSLSLCEQGMHFCRKAVDCFNYYQFDPNNKVAEVVAYGDVVEKGDKCCTNKLRVIREISWRELLDIVNTGRGCSGLGNSGDWNSGDWNSGDWNKCSYSNGCFNTVEPKIHLFNKPSDWTYTDWNNSEARYILNMILTDGLLYVYFQDMTDEEKRQYPEAEITGGYLKKINAPTLQTWWQRLSDVQKAIVKGIPNFDSKIFKEITGIDVEE